MNKDKFIALSAQERNETYGGFAWLLQALPLLFTAISTVVGAVKAFTSPDGGSIKTTSKGVETHWNGNTVKASRAPKSSSSKTAKVASPVYYAY